MCTAPRKVTDEFGRRVGPFQKFLGEVSGSPGSVEASGAAAASFLTPIHWMALAVCVLSWATVAVAVDEPVYEPAPEWVVQGVLPEKAAADGESPLDVLLWDQQVHVDAEGLHAYTRMALRIDTPQGLMGLNTLSTEWSPGFQTLAIHQVAIHRGDEVIDLLGRGQRFSVLRRESNLEFAMLDGALTAVLQPEGLRVGDVVDFAFTISGSDPALQGMAQSVIVAPQFSVEKALLRASWDRSVHIRWQATGALRDAVHESRSRGAQAVEISLDSAEPYVPPTGAPARYLIEPHIELSSFSSWQQVSSQMAPLFERATQLPADSLVQHEIERIQAAFDTPLERASAALTMVQDDVRYLFVALDAGGLVPASAEETWTRRFGDCKGKSALLLALLHGLGIHAEPVLVQSIAGDALPDRLPMIGAFDHVVVRAEIDDRVYWLDGTLAGGQPIDRISTPFFHWGLPIRLQGAELVEIRPAPPTEPDTRVAINLDFSAGITAPGQADGEIVLTGEVANYFQQGLATMTAAQVEQALRSVGAGYYPKAQIESVEGSYDSSSGEYSIAMTGTVSSLWSGRRYRSAIGDLVFVQDIAARPQDQDQEAPYAIVFPSYVDARETLTLPQGGRGFTIDGDEVDATLMGVEMHRSTRIDGATVVIEGSARSVRSEIPASEVEAAKRRLKALGGRQLYVVAPATYRASTEEQQSALGPDPVSADDYIDRGIVHLDNRRYGLAVVDFTSAIELAPENSYGWANRGIAHAWQNDADKARQDLEAAEAIDPDNAVVFRGYGLLAIQQGNNSEAIEQFTRAIELDPDSAFSYNMRSRARGSINDLDGAFQDSRTATRLNPAMAEPYIMRAGIQALRGRTEQAVEEFDAMLASASVDPTLYRGAARMLSRFGERKKAIDAISLAFEVQPMAGDLLLRAELRDDSDMAAKQADLEAALEIEPASREARLGLAAMHIDAGEPEDALPLLDELIEWDASDVEALGERGIALTLSGDSDLAGLDFEAARASAGSANSLNELCWRKATLNVALDEAVQDCLHAIELEESFAYYDSLGFAYLRLDRYEDSIEAYDTALDLSARNTYSLFGRALAKRALGDEAGYEKDMGDAVSLEPEIEAAFERYGITP